MTSTPDGLAAGLGAAILASTPSESPDRDPLAMVARVAEAEVVIRELLRQSVTAARSAGHSWAAIGTELGMTRQAAQQRFGSSADPGERVGDRERWLGPVTTFDELTELEFAGRRGWHTVEAGMLRHRMVRTGTQWQHKRVVWPVGVSRHESEGWQIGCRAFPWVYLIRDTGIPAEPE